MLAPGNSNYQLSTEYRTYDVTGLVRNGDNTLGVELGNGTAYVRPASPTPRSAAPRRTVVAEPAQGQRRPRRAAAAGATTVKLNNVANYHVGGTVNIDTGDGGERLESRTITAIGTAGADGTGITFTPGLAAGTRDRRRVTGSGNNIAEQRPERRRRRHAAADRPPGITYGRRHGRDRRQRPLAGGRRSARLVTDALVLRRRLRRPPRTGRLGPPPARTCGRPRSGGTVRPWTGSTPASPRRRTSPPSWSGRAAEPVKVVETVHARSA